MFFFCFIVVKHKGQHSVSSEMELFFFCMKLTCALSSFVISLSVDKTKYGYMETDKPFQNFFFTKVKKKPFIFIQTGVQFLIFALAN